MYLFVAYNFYIIGVEKIVMQVLKIGFDMA